MLVDMEPSQFLAFAQGRADGPFLVAGAVIDLATNGGRLSDNSLIERASALLILGNERWPEEPWVVITGIHLFAMTMSYLVDKSALSHATANTIGAYFKGGMVVRINPKPLPAAPSWGGTFFAEGPPAWGIEDSANSALPDTPATVAQAVYDLSRNGKDYEAAGLAGRASSNWPRLPWLHLLGIGILSKELRLTFDDAKVDQGAQTTLELLFNKATQGADDAQGTPEA
jgi:hypothetical protein